ncbi:RsmB/NOP family class I SAM-dependent RNA methyltransferase [Altererythrobacter arenosus]|uniref:RsmB/NOP family class I SAM-dependent RNA methyltransferase n=1 Tax=Altererythrobacter arenosus TaxID=3032592 RepID=A0ABY8FQE1_9SPHN|nr:RsmB/NOP family class I SAM-dependent RNA methyltransferase [Altererythrobacter sp. CAU 1644]WFL77231.1 RsmB/NOP family class I SAM-dependent RNA methyltransferase [Altererythrobacter sp. CAU 1644]
MTPAARVQAAIEILDAVIEAARTEGAPADRLVAAYFKTRRYAGSKDRRAVRELVYRAIRLCGEVPASGRAAMGALAAKDEAILQLFDGSNHGPAALDSGEAMAAPGIAPAWLVDRLEAAGIDAEEREAMLGRAPLDVRVNTLKADRASLELPEQGEALTAPQALRFPSGTQVEQWEAYRDGLIEVQDHGSQLVCLAAGASPGETVIDLCAGAGGKTLGLAAQMENRGTLLACDIDRNRLSRLSPRAERAGAGMIEPLLLNPGKEIEGLGLHAGTADLVLVDAPCSGTGTWRRKPEAKWRLTPDRLKRFAATQDHLLGIAARIVKPGGRICFVTCSLLDEEGKDRIDAFLLHNPGWTALPAAIPIGRSHGQGTRLTPSHDGTDGFFVAMLGSPC